MRVCVVYDCLFPHTVGGAERWYRELSQRLAADGHDVTYLTLRQWPRGTDPGMGQVPVKLAGPRMDLYTGPRRRILPPLVFGAGVLWHLLRHGRRYDVVHTASFPYFSLLAAAAARPFANFEIFVDWHELWTREYWSEYLGSAAGGVGWAVQRLCVHVRQRAFCFSHLHSARLRAQGLRGPVTVLTGEYAGPIEPPSPQPAEPVVVFAGRHIPEKRVPALVAAIAAARRQAPELRAEIYGDGPDRPAVQRRIDEHELGDSVSLPGFVDAGVIDAALARAMCMVLPSRREGYGLVVVEASARGTPSIVVRDPDNAAVELVDEGENGFVAESASAEDLAEAILRVRACGEALRASCARWFARNAQRLSLDSSLETVAADYARAGTRRSSRRV